MKKKWGGAKEYKKTNLFFLFPSQKKGLPFAFLFFFHLRRKFPPPLCGWNLLCWSRMKKKIQAKASHPGPKPGKKLGSFVQDIPILITMN